MKRKTTKFVFVMLVWLLGINTGNAQIVSTLAGSWKNKGYVDGLDTAARFNSPNGIAADRNGNLYVADFSNNEIRKIVISTGMVTTLAGSTTPGSADGVGTAARFYGPNSVATDTSGNLYVADFGNNEIRKIVIATGMVTTLAGSTTYGNVDGIGAAARFANPLGVVADNNGNLYVADEVNTEIRKIVIATASVTTLAGGGNGYGGIVNGTGKAALFECPIGLILDGTGNLYVADRCNNNIRKMVIADTVVTSFAGSYPGISSYSDGTGTAAYFNQPCGFAMDISGNYLYVADANNNEIRKIEISTAIVTTFIGVGYNSYAHSGHADGNATTASFNYPCAITSDTSGNLYVADGANNEIRKIAVATTGINELNTSNEIRVYPNPSNGRFIIDVKGNNRMARVEVYSVLGERVYTSKLYAPKTQLDLSVNVSGIYLYRLLTETGSLVSEGKFVIQK